MWGGLAGGVGGPEEEAPKSNPLWALLRGGPGAGERRAARVRRGKGTASPAASPATAAATSTAAAVAAGGGDEGAVSAASEAGDHVAVGGADAARNGHDGAQQQEEEEEEQQQQQQHEEEEAFIPVGAPDPPAGPLPTSGGGVGGNNGSGGGVSAAAARRPPWARAAVYHEVAHLALHQEILDFEQYISPSRKEREARSGLVGRLHEVVSEMFPQAELKLFGSLATDLYLPTCVQSPFTLLVVGNGGELMRAGRLLCVGPTSMCV
jgi:hypothetical protein